MAVTTTMLAIDGPVGLLEAMLEEPAAGIPEFVGVVCHPHPQFEGTMLNKVVHALSRSMTDSEIAVLRFNYRGVGASAGTYDDGRGETLDATAAVDFMRHQYPGAAVVLAGFSFGAGVAIRHAMARAPAALITVAPPVTRTGIPELTDIASPWLVVQGGADELVDSKAVETWVNLQQPPPHLQVLAAADHFFHGNLTRLRQLATAFLRTSLSFPPRMAP